MLQDTAGTMTKDQCKAMRTSLKEKMVRDNLLSVAKSAGHRFSWYVKRL